jgi:hypothetical protein
MRISEPAQPVYDLNNTYNYTLLCLSSICSPHPIGEIDQVISIDPVRLCLLHQCPHSPPKPSRLISCAPPPTFDPSQFCFLRSAFHPLDNGVWGGAESESHMSPGWELSRRHRTYRGVELNLRSWPTWRVGYTSGSSESAQGAVVKDDTGSRIVDVGQRCIACTDDRQRPTGPGGSSRVVSRQVSRFQERLKSLKHVWPHGSTIRLLGNVSDVWYRYDGRTKSMTS